LCVCIEERESVSVAIGDNDDGGGDRGAFADGSARCGERFIESKAEEEMQG